jgi:hypothetical protein
VAASGPVSGIARGILWPRGQELPEKVAVGAVDLDAVGDTRYQPPKSLEGSTISAVDIRRRQPFCGADKKSPAG